MYCCFFFVVVVVGVPLLLLLASPRGRVTLSSEWKRVLYTRVGVSLGQSCRTGYYYTPSVSWVQGNTSRVMEGSNTTTRKKIHNTYIRDWKESSSPFAVFMVIRYAFFRGLFCPLLVGIINWHGVRSAREYKTHRGRILCNCERILYSRAWES